MTRQNHKRGFNLSSSNSEAIGQPCKGFNLIEAAIVLAVVGGVIGAIWSAAANFYENYKVNKTVEGVFTIAGNVQNLISSRDAGTIGSENITTAMRNAGVFPKDWVNGNDVTNPLGGSGVVSIKTDSYFYIHIKKLTIAQCTKLIVRASSISAASGNKGGIAADKYRTGALLFFNVGGWSVATVATFPASPEIASTACETGLYSDVPEGNLVFAFSYTRINN